MINTNVLYDLQVLYSVDGNGKKLWNKIINKINNSNDNTQIINYLTNLIIKQPNNELTLDILDFIITYGNNNIISLIAEKEFMNKFISLLKKEVNANIKIQMKVIFLIQKWAIKFNNDINSIFSIFNEYYDYLLNKGIVFPPVDNQMETYNKFIKDEEVEIINSQYNKNLYNNLNDISLPSDLTINYNNPFSDNNHEKNFVSDLSIINQGNEIDYNSFNPYDFKIKNQNNNKNNNYNNHLKNENNNKNNNYNNHLKNENNNMDNNRVGLKIINNFYNSNINNNKINNQNKPNSIYDTFVNKVSKNNPFQSYNNKYPNYNQKKNSPYKSMVIPNDNLINNHIYGLKLQEPIKEKNKWCHKIYHYNKIIDEEKGGICYNDELKNGMQEFTEVLNIINLYISQYSIANDVDTKDMFIKVRNDMEMTLFRYNQLLSNKNVIPFYSAFDGNKKRYDENYYSQEDKKENNNTFGNKIKNGIFNFGSTIKEKTVDGYDYLRDKIKGNKNIYGYDYNDNSNDNNNYPSYSNKFEDNKEMNYNINDNNNSNTNNEENKRSFLYNVKEGFFNISK